ncbi:hypothetical protein BN1184_BS_01190 [Pantoea ananatis]|nr:hypothetical protein BN1184_BS_01190 [Pantoea ananatis]
MSLIGFFIKPVFIIYHLGIPLLRYLKRFDYHRFQPKTLLLLYEIQRPSIYFLFTYLRRIAIVAR